MHGKILLGEKEKLVYNLKMMSNLIISKFYKLKKLIKENRLNILLYKCIIFSFSEKEINFHFQKNLL